MRLEELERELLEERPEVDPDFATRLDEWAARGFPRGDARDPLRDRRRGRGRFSFLRRHAQPARKGPKRGWARILSTEGGVAGAMAALLIALVVGVSQLEPGGDDHSAGDDSGAEALDAEPAPSEPVPASGGASEEALGSGGGAAIRQADAGRVGNLSGGGRQVAQSISLSLATSPADFRDAADGVLDVVSNHNGFVMRSNVSGGDPEVDGAARGEATFRMRIPANQLQAALGALSDLGHVVSRTDGTQDITSRFDSARERISTYTESRDNLLNQLEEATTEEEQDSIEASLRTVERRLERAQDDLARAQQRVRMVPVSVSIVADESIEGGGSWGVGDAFDDAGDILRTALAIGLISAAVLLPIALIALIAFLASRAFARHQRERALDERGA